MDLGIGEIVVILAIVLLLFGPSKLPRLGEGLGSALANFRKGLRGGEDPEPKPVDVAERRVAPLLPEASPQAVPMPVTSGDAAAPAQGS